MAISCLQVIREISNYIDQAVDPVLQAEIEEHLSECDHCTAVFDGATNVIRLVSDVRTFELPAGFSARVREKLAELAPA